jgi:DNA-binding transcriptional ArsR family regulator
MADDLFKALADDTRRRILDELTERNGQTLFEICSRLAMRYEIGSSRQAISQHLDVLESAGLVETRREGRYKFHYIDPNTSSSAGYTRTRRIPDENQPHECARR